MRKSLVTVQRLIKPGEGETYGNEDLMATDNYVLTTRRLDGQFVHFVEMTGSGDRWRIPGRVIEQIVRHRTSIATEGRQVQARERFERQAQAKPELDGPLWEDLEGLVEFNRATSDAESL